MAKYEYVFSETCSFKGVIVANTREEADQIAKERLICDEIDWGEGDMQSSCTLIKELA